ncbi:teicoplanin resistance protein VanZ [Candidatus Fermentibacteria bacterium]|nr:MAG: teicoplanin resistance protein VanZ [Candidatus Fermentibacteria bacterium]
MKQIPCRLFLLLVVLLIPALSHQPSLKPPFELFPFQDKIFHMAEFGGLAFAMVLNREDLKKRMRVPAMLSFGFFWGALDELHQSFVPGRDCSAGDFAADSIGLIIGVFLFLHLAERIELRRQAKSSDSIL